MRATTKVMRKSTGLKPRLTASPLCFSCALDLWRALYQLPAPRRAYLRSSHNVRDNISRSEKARTEPDRAGADVAAPPHFASPTTTSTNRRGLRNPSLRWETSPVASPRAPSDAPAAPTAPRNPSLRWNEGEKSENVAFPPKFGTGTSQVRGPYSFLGMRAVPDGRVNSDASQGGLPPVSWGSTQPPPLSPSADQVWPNLPRKDPPPAWSLDLRPTQTQTPKIVDFSTVASGAIRPDVKLARTRIARLNSRPSPSDLPIRYNVTARTSPSITLREQRLRRLTPEEGEEPLLYGERYGIRRDNHRSNGYSIDNRFQRSRRRDLQSRYEARLSRQEDEDEYDDDDEEYAERWRPRRAGRRTDSSQQGPKPILLPEYITASNLAVALRVRVPQFIRMMEEMGFEHVTPDVILDSETAGLVAREFNYEPQELSSNSEEDLQARPAPDDDSLLLSRPPVVTIMGHVDHGKTSLLDWLRKSSIAAGEHGGITQHIGAFMVELPSGRVITFLDTPGHSAFEEMRARGANVTDMVILVVAGDDSVKPQTIEAIKHAKAAGVPMIVAINKMDKEDADADQVRRDLSRYDVTVEEFGGETQAVCISAVTGQGMTELQEAVTVQADILDPRADASGAVEGWILEGAQRQSGRTATVLVRRGTLTSGQILVAGMSWARVRTLRNEAGVEVNEAGPGTAVEVDGWREQPEAGAEVLEASSEQRARRALDVRQDRSASAKLGNDVAAVNKARREEDKRREREKEELRQNGNRPSRSTRAASSPSGPVEVPFMLRADVSGSVEAVQSAVLSLGNAQVHASVLRAAVGSVSPSDIEHAQVTNASIITFNVSTDPSVLRLAEQAGVRIISGSIIYRLLDDVKDELTARLPLRRSSRVTGEADLAQVFEVRLRKAAPTTVAGCRVRNGLVRRDSPIRILRDRKIVYDGTLASLRNHREDVHEIRKGSDCGLVFKDFTDFRVGDSIQCYEVIEEKQTLESILVDATSAASESQIDAE